MQVTINLQVCHVVYGRGEKETTVATYLVMISILHENINEDIDVGIDDSASVFERSSKLDTLLYEWRH